MSKKEIVNVNNLTPEQMEALQNEMNTRRFKNLEETTNELDERVSKIEDNAPVTPAVSNFLTRMRRARVIKWLGGKGSKAYKHSYRAEEKEHYKKLSNKVFAEMERDFKDYFKINVYADLPRKVREEAENYIREWEPNNNTKLEIRNINNQLELFRQGEM